MSTSLATLIRLRAIQNKTRALFENMSDIHYRLQFHHALSPAGWYLGRSMFIENYWLHEVIANNRLYTQDTHLFIAQNCPRAQRGPRLPPLKTQLEVMPQQQDNNALLLLEKTPPLSKHVLFKDEYIENYIIQQYAQDYRVLIQIALKTDKGRYTPEKHLQAQQYERNTLHIEQGNYTVGGALPNAYDLELPAHSVFLKPYQIAKSPVNNAEYLCFMQEGGYTTPRWWSPYGWQWRDKNNIICPEHWRKNAENQWYAVSAQGALDLLAEDFVYGLSHYEACAFAQWAGARLPHEHEWESAARTGQLVNTTKVWEWCENTLFPYDNFQTFPDNPPSPGAPDYTRIVLKGASIHTRPEIRRASFRNAHSAHQRHIFAGLRPVFD